MNKGPYHPRPRAIIAKIVILASLILLTIAIVLWRGFDLAKLLTPCPFPCWYDITPGSTLADQTVRRLRENPTVIPFTIIESPLRDGIEIFWLPLTGGYIYVAYASDNIIQVVSMQRLLSRNVTLNEVLDQFGNPEKIQVRDTVYGNHALGYNFTIYYPRQGLVAISEVYGRVDPIMVPIRADMVLDELYRFPSGSVTETIQFAKGLPLGTAPGGNFRVPLQDWHGFGTYDILPYLRP